MVTLYERRGPPLILLAPAALCLVFVICAIVSWSLRPVPPPHTNLCPQPAALAPALGALHGAAAFFSKSYARKSQRLLSGAVRIPTVAYDDMAADPAADERFAVFAELNAFLERRFPLSAAHGRLEYVNTHGMLYTFAGSDAARAPLLLMAHQDVVPVAAATADQWTHPPFSGAFDGEFVWGRGAADTKNTVVAILEATEALLAQGWAPAQTVLVALGFDEEISGERGAVQIARLLEARYGRHGVEAIVDEGGGCTELYGSRVCKVDVAEKGYVDVKIAVRTPGGHSSVPPDHTAIGLLAEVVTELEGHAFAAALGDGNPSLAMYQCLAEHAPGVPPALRRAALEIHRGRNRERVLRTIEAAAWPLVRTSQAVDVIEGGVKINALPEAAAVTVNYRVDVESSVAAVVARAERLVAAVARRRGLGATAAGGRALAPGTAAGNFSISVIDPREPAPFAPTDGRVWAALAGTTRHVFDAVDPVTRSAAGEPGVLVIPGVLVGATDTDHFWNVSSQIYRFEVARDVDAYNMHTVDEHMRLAGHLRQVAWYYEFLVNLAGAGITDGGD